MNLDIETLAVNTIKGLAMDAVQAAKSGHPGAPMGMADIATVLWRRFVKYDPADPHWPDRDRVVLSNGHASMLLYSMIHLTGLKDDKREHGEAISLEDIKHFRQWGYPTDGHPEYGHATGVETTTGPLGQGVGNGVGFAMAERWLRAQFGEALVNHFTYVLCGDGCLMEGVASEAASLAGHLKLGRLIMLYDQNSITIDGTTDLAFGEDVAMRFHAYGWQIINVDGHNREAIASAVEAAKAETTQPSLILCRTKIAHSAATMEGSNKTHGSPLGEEEIRATKTALGMDPDAHFVVPESVLTYFRGDDADRAAQRAAWQERLDNHADAERFRRFHQAPDLSAVAWPDFPVGKTLATRAASGSVLQALAGAIDNLIGGSADLAGSNKTYLKSSGDVSGTDFAQRNLHFGVREHGMGAISNGLILHGGIQPYCATFLVFHDYMRPSVRLAALMKQPVIYVYTHDSVYLGEDGPTHQPVEQMMATRSIPNLCVMRPADANETAEAWKFALQRRDGPTALVLTRQGLPTVDRETMGSAEGVHRGAYVLCEAEGGTPKVILIATGSEVTLAITAQAALEASGIATRVVSMPCWEAFDAQSAEYRAGVLPAGIPRVSVEAGITHGWERYVGLAGASVGIDRFGASAPGHIVAEQLGMTVSAIQSAVSRVLGE